MIERLRLTAIGSALEQARRPGPRARRFVLAGATIVFLAIVVWGVNGYRSAGLALRPPIIVLAASVGTLLALALNAIELRIMGSAADAELTAREATIATLFASAANSLPLPGSVLVRGWSLTRKGADLATVVRIQATAGAAFVAVALALTGPILATSAPIIGLVFGSLGMAAVAGLLAWAPRYVRRLMVVEAAMVGSELARFSLVLAALGVEVTAARASGMVIANVLAVAIGVFPAGLGVREALAAVLAGATSLAAPVAVTVSVTDRVATSLVLAVLVGLAWSLGSRLSPSDELPEKPLRPRIGSIGVRPDPS